MESPPHECPEQVFHDGQIKKCSVVSSLAPGLTAPEESGSDEGGPSPGPPGPLYPSLKSASEDCSEGIIH